MIPQGLIYTLHLLSAISRSYQSYINTQLTQLTFICASGLVQIWQTLAVLSLSVLAEKTCLLITRAHQSLKSCHVLASEQVHFLFCPVAFWHLSIHTHRITQNYTRALITFAEYISEKNNIIIITTTRRGELFSSYSLILKFYVPCNEVAIQ